MPWKIMSYKLISPLLSCLPLYIAKVNGGVIVYLYFLARTKWILTHRQWYSRLVIQRKVYTNKCTNDNFVIRLPWGRIISRWTWRPHVPSFCMRETFHYFFTFSAISKNNAINCIAVEHENSFIPLNVVESCGMLVSNLLPTLLFRHPGVDSLYLTWNVCAV